MTLDAGGKDLRCTALSCDRRRAAVYRTARHIGGKRLALVADGAGEVEQTAEHRVAHWHLERAAGGVRAHATAQPCRRLQGDRAHRCLIEMRLHLSNDRGALVGRNEQGFVDRWQHLAVKGDVQHRPANRGHPAVDCLCRFHVASTELSLTSEFLEATPVDDARN